MNEIKYKRIMLKVSGEALAGEQRRGLDFDVIGYVDPGVTVSIIKNKTNFFIIFLLLLKKLYHQNLLH